MSVFDKPLEQLCEKDILQLQAEGVEEGVLLDYKVGSEIFAVRYEISFKLLEKMTG